MKDLVGPAPFVLANCSASLTTTPSAGVTEATQVLPGQNVTDLAVVQGVNTAGDPPTPTGNVTFFLCGPTANDSTALCETGGAQVEHFGAGEPVRVGDAVVFGVHAAIGPSHHAARLEFFLRDVGTD